MQLWFQNTLDLHLSGKVKNFIFRQIWIYIYRNLLSVADVFGEISIFDIESLYLSMWWHLVYNSKVFFHMCWFLFSLKKLSKRNPFTFGNQPWLLIFFFHFFLFSNCIVQGVKFSAMERGNWTGIVKMNMRKFLVALKAPP